MQLAPVVVVALAAWRSNERLFEALRGAARGVMAAAPACRFACVTVVPPAAALSGEGDENSATGRHIKRLVELHRWAKPLQLPEERLTYHVLESDKPALALIEYAKMNDVDQILIGAPGSGASARSFAGVCARVVAGVPCSVTVVRPRLEG
jgi:nucleotide-binding universal stress UspA family protein